MEKVWACVDVGKGFHWAHVVDTSGKELLSRRVENDEADLLALIEEALSLAGDVTWAVDQPGGGAALLLALLWEHGQGVAYVPGLSVDRARDGYRGESKTDRKDARVIADQARMRADLGRLEPGDEALAELQLLLARRRRDLVADRTRAVARLRETLLALFPALESAFNFNTRGPLELVARYQSAGAIRRAGRRRIAAYLEDYNAQAHWAPRERKDGRRSPREVLGWLTGVRYRPEYLERAFFSARFSRVLDSLGYARFRDWRLYGEEGLAKREAAVWLQPDSLTVEFAGETLSRYDVELAVGTGELRSVGRPRLFENSHVLPQLRLFALEEAGWIKALKLSGYVPRRHRKPAALQDVLFPFLAGTGG